MLAPDRYASEGSHNPIHIVPSPSANSPHRALVSGALSAASPGCPGALHTTSNFQMWLAKCFKPPRQKAAAASYVGPRTIHSRFDMLHLVCGVGNIQEELVVRARNYLQRTMTM